MNELTFIYLSRLSDKAGLAKVDLNQNLNRNYTRSYRNQILKELIYEKFIAIIKFPKTDAIGRKRLIKVYSLTKKGRKILEEYTHGLKPITSTH